MVTFYNLSLLKFLSHTQAVPQRCSPGGGFSAGVLQIFGSTFVRGYDFNKVSTRLW